MEDKIPYISNDIIEYFDKLYSADALLAKDCKSAESKLGYMQGVREVINMMKVLNNM